MADRKRVWNPVPWAMDPLHVPEAAPKSENYKKRKIYDSYDSLLRADRFMPEPAMKWKRVLGMGGYGIAVKYERTCQDGRLEDVVVKVDKRGDADDFAREWRWYKRFEGSEHIPRLIGNLQPTEESSDRPNEMSTFGLLDRRLMVMEYLEYGDLRGLIERQSEHYAKTGEYCHAPDRLLWSFFLCLARSCMALAWPRKSGREISAMYRMMDDQYKGMLPKSEWKPPTVPETMRERPQETAPRRIVHFDMDPTNVLVGNPTFNPESDAEHESVPILKLNDFGLTTEFTGYESVPELEMFRGWGKPAYLAPEQTGETAISEQSFTEKANIWGMGVTMFALITRCCPVGQPVGEDARFMCKRDGAKDDEGDDKGLVEKVVQGTVHARALGILDDGSEPFGGVDAELRVLVARCMCEDPRRRPALAQLEGELTKGLERAAEAEAAQAKARGTAGNAVHPAPRGHPEYLRDFVQCFFRDAPAFPSDKQTWLPSEKPHPPPPEVEPEW